MRTLERVVTRFHIKRYLGTKLCVVGRGAADLGGVLSVLVRLEQERECRGVAGSGGGPLVAFQSASCPSKAGYFAGKQT